MSTTATADKTAAPTLASEAAGAAIHQIALDQLRDSPFNPRRTFTGLEELAASIRAEGRIHEPLLVRPHK